MNENLLKQLLEDFKQSRNMSNDEMYKALERMKWFFYYKSAQYKKDFPFNRDKYVTKS